MFTKRIPPEIRFWAHVNKSGSVPIGRPDLGPCWEWLAYRNALGYGVFAADTKSNTMAHRFSLGLVGVVVPHGLHTDHLCRNPGCVNPAHLEVVPPAENIFRGVSPIGRWAGQDQCKQGHAFTPENTRWATNGTRRCWICNRAWRRKRYAARPEVIECRSRTPIHDPDRRRRQNAERQRRYRAKKRSVQ
jgi:hypothetical protein